MPKISDPVETIPRIVVDDVHKDFKLRHTHSIKETFVAAVQRKPLTSDFHALDGVSFTIGPGEAVALLGFNGSGKSTMLKMISGVLTPDQGQVLTRGRVAGLIEVGAGFHPDLSGRENIYLNAAILGMSKAETDARYDDIVAFSEIEKFIDTEVKHYSSGMFLRLAFSVAIHTEVDILLIDEILSVGDEPFQKKCLARIRELHAAGKTLVVVSHDLDMIAKLCDRGIILRDGKVELDSDATAAVERLRRIGWSPFVDVTHDHPLLDEMISAVDRGLMSGTVGTTGDTHFLPRAGVSSGDARQVISALGLSTDADEPDDAILTRAELAQMLYSAASPGDRSLPSKSPFADVATGHFAYAAVTWLAEAGVAQGWSEDGRSASFQPDSPAKREELAAFAVRLQNQSSL